MNLKYSKENTGRLTTVSTCLMAFGINLPIEFTPFFLSLWILTLLLHTSLHFNFQNVFSQSNYPFIALILFYFWCFFTLIYTSNTGRGINILETRLSLLVISILGILFSEKIGHRRLILKFFILGNIFSIIWCLVSYNTFEAFGPTDFRIMQFRTVISNYKHHNYLGLNLSIGLILVAYLINIHKTRFQVFIASLFSALYFIFIYLAQSQMSLFVLSLCILILFGIIFYKSKNQKKSLVFIVLIFVVLVALIKNSPLLKEINYSDISIENIDKERAVLWQKSVELIKENPFFGLGLGDSEIIQHLSNPIASNSHNQILSFFLEGGIISVILFFSSWGFLLYFFRNSKIKLYVISILLIFFLFLLVESTFDRIANISLFIFIFFLFLKTQETARSVFSNSFKNAKVFIPLLLIVLISFSLYTLYITNSKISFDPKNPKTFATVAHKIISSKNLPVSLYKDLPVDTDGYFLDARSFSKSWNGNAYSYSKINEIHLASTDSLYAYVYCYVSEDFNGTWVRLNGQSDQNNNKSSYYDLEKKGTWQKLEINYSSIDSYLRLLLFIAKYNSTDFSSLKGHVIFAHPSYTLITGLNKPDK